MLNFAFCIARIPVLFAWSMLSAFVIRKKYYDQLARQNESRSAADTQQSASNVSAARTSFPRLSFRVFSADTSGSPTVSAPTSPQMEPPKLDPVLRHPATLNLFMQALAKEYSMEVLLSYIEFDQYERYIMKLKNEITVSATMHSLHLPTMHSTMHSTLHSTLHSTMHSTMHSAMHSTLHSTMHATKRGNFPEIKEGDQEEEKEPDWDADPDEIWSRHVVPATAHSTELVADVPDIETMQTLRNVPKSIIVEAAASSLKGANADEQTLHDVKKKAHLLYLKYIKVGSDLEINIQWQTRKYLMNILENKHELYHGERGKKLKLGELSMLFHEAKEEMKMLLSFSWTRMRFHSPNEYQQCLQILDNKENAGSRHSSCL